MKDEITIICNGNQLEYMIGDTMKTFENTKEGMDKAMRYISQFYVIPDVAINGKNYYVSEYDIIMFKKSLLERESR